jgi:hypothetical protein
LEDGWSSGQGRAKGRGPALKKSAHVAEDDAEEGAANDLNSSGGKSKQGLKPKETKAPDVVAYNPFDMLNETDSQDDEDDE